jgi:hypothetical protein
MAASFTGATMILFLMRPNPKNGIGPCSDFGLCPQIVQPGKFIAGKTLKAA